MWLRTGVKSQIFYEYPQKSISRQILDRGHYSIKLQKEGQGIFSHTGTVNRCWTVCLLK